MTTEGPRSRCIIKWNGCLYMTINHFEVWRDKNGWIAVRDEDDYTIMADTFSELIIKIGQTQQEQ